MVYAFNRVKQQFDGFHGYSVLDKPFEECWIPPKHCKPGPDDPIDINALPPLLELPKLPASLVKKEEPGTLVAEPDTDLELQKVLDRKRQEFQDHIDRYGQISPFIAPEAMKYLDGGR